MIGSGIGHLTCQRANGFLYPIEGAIPICPLQKSVRIIPVSLLGCSLWRKKKNTRINLVLLLPLLRSCRLTLLRKQCLDLVRRSCFFCWANNNLIIPRKKFVNYKKLFSCGKLTPLTFPLTTKLSIKLIGFFTADRTLT